MLALIQSYRGIAAVLVVLYHAEAAAQQYFGASWLGVFDFGRAGVQFFFVLSGYIIYYVHREDVGTGAVAPYLKKRATRVYPLYVLVTLVLAPVFFLVPSFGEPYHRDPAALLMSLALIPQGHQPHLAVAWTLVHEVIFYALFATLILNRTVGRYVLGAWLAAVIVANVMTSDIPYPLAYLLSANNLLFGLGMLTAACQLRGGWPTFLLGNAAFLATGLITQTNEGALVILSYGLASAAILSTAASLDAYFKHRAMRALGDASYAIYLTHYPAISVVCKIMSMLGIASTSIAFAISSLVAVIGGVAIHYWIEVPLLGFFRHRRRVQAA